MKTPRTIPSPLSTPPSPHSLPSRSTALRTLTSKKPRKILTNPTPTTQEQEDLKWVALKLSRSELYLPLTFPTGQTFRWKQTGPIQYTGVVGRSHLVLLKQLDNGDVGYYFYSTTATESKSLLLGKLFLIFSIVLRQEPLECLIQFICSSNNNIKRITMMVDFISSLGNFLGTVGGFEFYEFPSLESLAIVSKQELRAAGFGYRAKYIVGTVEALKSKPGKACISLFSLDQHHAIPIDTHVWKIATRYLLPELAGTSLTPKISNHVANAFVSTYGKYAGWAQTLLFIAELPSQKALLNSKEEKSPNSRKRKLGRDDKAVLSSSHHLRQAKMHLAGNILHEVIVP
ncbi:N-glycosylase/DNA lyase OGG1 [Capsicum annuum]|uniref:DNA-(apurinic or apyrimidinic site) lyase n=1 Tax=Capsicum annuum TaxID=4072 RepID=A0A2G2ZPN6_CAPAN|nr:N-glycosylase/DNA lyase OGG1 [Capsicum annuum]PHT83907.1 N-glycosylase/DNA lyase OGG1 [Capsicum annuum]